MKDIKERFFSYLNGEMDVPDKQFFNHEIWRDKFLEVIRENDLLELEGRQKIRRISVKRKHLVIAAGIFMIWGISVVFFNNPSKSQNDRIFANYYRTYKMDNKLVYRVPSNNDYGIAYDQYREGNYREAINEFEGIIRHDTTRITACFLLGISFIEVQNYSEAIKNLAYVIDQNSGIIQQAEWYLALCYIKTRKTAQANLMLNRIIDENNCYKQLASEILKKIKS